MVEQLQADAAAQPGFRGCSDAPSARPEGRVGVFARAGGGAQDVDQGADGLLALGPEQLARFLRAQDGRVGLYGNVLQAAVLAFGQAR